MTVETRTTIEFSDIKSIEFECANCHTKTAVPIDKFKQPPISCHGCDSQQWFIPGSKDLSDLMQMVGSMGRFSGIGKVLFTMRFDITNAFALGPEEA